MRDSGIGCFSSSAISQINNMDDLHTFRPVQKSPKLPAENSQNNQNMKESIYSQVDKQDQQKSVLISHFGLTPVGKSAPLIKSSDDIKVQAMHLVLDRNKRKNTAQLILQANEQRRAAISQNHQNYMHQHQSSGHKKEGDHDLIMSSSIFNSYWEKSGQQRENVAKSCLVQDKRE